jgi:hypothetical protein
VGCKEISSIGGKLSVCRCPNLLSLVTKQKELDQLSDGLPLPVQAVSLLMRAQDIKRRISSVNI